MAKEYYVKEFFDREYSKREAYGRVWKYARPYRLRLFVGIVCGLLTAGTLVPLFQMVQPAVGTIEQRVSGPEVEAEAVDAVVPAAPEAVRPTADTDLAKSLPSWYPKVEKLARRCGITLMDEKGALKGAVVLLVLIVLPLLAMVRLGMKFASHYLLSWVGARATADLSCDLMHHVQRQSLGFFGRVNVGQLLSRICSDPNQMRTILHSMVADLSEAPFEILVSVGFVIWYAISHEMIATLVIIAIAFPVFMFPLRAIAKVIKKWSKATMERASGVFSRIHEVLTCIRLVKSSNTEQLEQCHYRKANDFMIKATMRSIRVGALVPFVMEFTGVTILCAFFCWCYCRGITLTDVMPMLAPLLVIYKPVRKLSKLVVGIETSMASLNRIYSLQDVDMSLPESAHPTAKRSFDEAIRFENVSFRYDTAERDAVRHATFEVRRGQKVAVVGGTGSGKSTLSSLFARFADPREGRVTMDGVDLKEISTDDLRALIGVVTQEALLFNEPIAYNVRYGSFEASDEAMVAAAKVANAHDFILSQPEGYGRLAGEKGFALSGGERQRIAIARAVLRNPPILVLDEATSALDTITERQVQTALEQLMANRTTFVIAHRLSTIRDADLILVMRDGEIVERGKHDELYAQGGVYRSLCDMQKAV